MANVRKKYTTQEKAKIALEALKGELTISQITAKYGVHSTQISNWKKQALEGIAQSFSGSRGQRQHEQNDLVDELYRQIGQLKVELDWMKKNLNYSADAFSR